MLLKDEQVLLIHDFKTKFLWGIRLRFGIILASIIVYFLGISGQVGLLPMVKLLLFVIAYNCCAFLLSFLKKQYKLWEIITIISICQLFDLLAVTLLIYFTGWLESPYWFLYLVLIIVSGFGIFSRYSKIVFIIALFSAFFYLGLMLAAYFAVIPVYGPQFSLPPTELLHSIINRAVFTVISFFLFAGTIYYFSQALTENQQSLVKKNLQLLATLEELKEIDRLKDEFVATASHELRTPLAVIRENTSMLHDGIAGAVSEQQTKLLDSATNNIDRLAAILDNLLNIAKIQSRSLELKRSETNIGQMAEKAISLLQGLAIEKKIVIKKEIMPKATIWIDQDQILRVFINLIDNAIKYTNLGGLVEVKVALEEKGIVCQVKDNGIGIKAEDLPRVFERFVRFNRAVEMSKRGSGLGLSICKGIIEMHGGKISVESREGGGTTFTFTLPKVETNG
jgi:signal transduction histidine kinase